VVLRLRVPAPGNWQQAKCRGQVQRLPDDDDIYDPFFLEEDEDEQDALDYCNGAIDGVTCPIRDACLLFALTNNERFGVWGGMSELARRALRRRWPWRGGKEPRPEWRWMGQEEALSLVTPEELADDGEDDTDDP
jgi:Transcription factor WhiB